MPELEQLSLTEHEIILKNCTNCDNFICYAWWRNKYIYYCNNVRCDNYTMLHDTSEDK